MAILVNGVAELEYDRNKSLSDDHQLSLDKMDHKMDAGFNLGGEFVSSPDVQQRALFVAGQLLDAMKTDNDQLAAALTAWLATRLPDLKQVKITDKDGKVLTDLVFDQAYGKQAVVNFQLH